MKRTSIFLIIAILFFFIEAKAQIINYQIQLAAYQDNLQFDKLDDFIKSSGFKEGGRVYNNRIPLGINMDLNINKFNAGINFYISKTNSLYYADKSTLKPSTDMILGRLGRNLRINEKSFFTVSTFIYAQSFYLDIANKSPATSQNSILYNPVSLNEYELSSTLGGTGYQASFNHNFKLRDKESSFDGVSLSAIFGYKIQVFNNSTWKLKLPSSNFQFQNGTSNSSVDTKIPNKELFNSTGLYFTVGIGYHMTSRNDRKNKIIPEKM